MAKKTSVQKGDQLTPGTNGHTLIIQILISNSILQTGRSVSLQLRRTRIAECLISDDAGVIVFTAYNDEVDVMKPSTTVILRNAKIDMFKGSTRLAVDKWGRLEVTESANFMVKEDNNLSLVAYEPVNVGDE